MTKKDYELIAQALKLTQNAPNTWTDTVACMARLLEQENAHFDRLKFMTACGMGTVHTFSDGKQLHDPYDILA